MHTVDEQAVGAGTAPTRNEVCSKWTNTSGQIDILQLFASAGNIGTGAEWRVWGSN